MDKSCLYIEWIVYIYKALNILGNKRGVCVKREI